MKLTFQGVSRLVMLDRYTQKDINYVSLSEGDLVICVTKDDPKFPTRGIGYVKKIEGNVIRKTRYCISTDDGFTMEFDFFEGDFYKLNKFTPCYAD